MEKTLNRAPQNQSPQKHVLKKRVIATLIFAFIVVFLIFACDNKLEITNYEITSDKISEEITAVLITDLHNAFYGENQQELLEEVKTANPDLILLAGDIYHDFGSDDGADALLSKVAEIAPSYYVLGNHEIASKRVEELLEKINSYNITTLSYDYAEIEVKGEKIVICGLDEYNIPNENNKLDELSEIDNYKILLAHQPEKIEEYSKYDVDLVLSGHVHGGQVFIPFIKRGLYVPNQGLFGKYSGGLYDYSETVTLIVSRGLSIKHPSPLIPRVFNRPELVVITIKGE